MTQIAERIVPSERCTSWTSEAGIQGGYNLSKDDKNNAHVLEFDRSVKKKKTASRIAKLKKAVVVPIA